MSETNYDLVVVGGGPGGYVAAIVAAQKGLKTALIEAREPGGVCLHAGCLPTKAMVASVDVLRHAKAATQFGLDIPSAGAALGAINARRQKIIQQLTQGVKFLLNKNGVELITGRAVFKSAREIEVRDAAGQVVRTISNPAHAIIATGSRPAEIPGIVVDHSRVLNSSDMLNLAELPRELIILGGGYIGCEFASVFAPLGSKVTVVEALPRLLPNMDAELGQGLERSFKKGGMQVMTNCRVEKVAVQDGVSLTLSNGQTLSGSHLLVAVGRVPNVENIGLEAAGVAFGKRGIEVNDALETAVPGVYAIGDVMGRMALAHVASAQGRFVVAQVAQKLGKWPAGAPAPLPVEYDAVPACVFTHPEIASVGLTEAEATQRGLTVRAGKFPFMAIGKALAGGSTDGFVKLVAEAATGRLVGGHIMGAHASEMIATLALAVRHRLTIHDLTETVFAHPTLGEAIHEAAESVFGKPIHMFTGR